MDEQGVFFGLALGIPAGVICLVMTCAIYIRASKMSNRHTHNNNDDLPIFPARPRGNNYYARLARIPPRVIALDIITTPEV